jgi:hypothetical protein
MQKRCSVILEKLWDQFSILSDDTDDDARIERNKDIFFTGIAAYSQLLEECKKKNPLKIYELMRILHHVDILDYKVNRDFLMGEPDKKV